MFLEFGPGAPKGIDPQPVVATQITIGALVAMCSSTQPSVVVNAASAAPTAKR
jgi:hypothetical protein